MKSAAVRPIESAAPATLLWCALGLLVPRATLFGELTPFGVGLAACAGAANLPTLLCLAVGYLLEQTSFLPLRYVITVITVGGMRWVLGALPELSRRPFVPPLLAFVSCAGTGLVILNSSGMDSYRALLILAESAVAAGSSLFFEAAMRVFRSRDRATLTPGGQAAVILTGAVAIMAASTLEVGGFAPGRVAAAFLVLVLARSGRESGGSMAGCILGGAMALVTPGQTPLAVALAFGGLVAGLFSRFGRTAQAGLFLLAAGVVTLGEVSDTMLTHIYELFTAGVLFVLLPREWDRRLCRLFIRSRDLPAVEGLRRMTGLRLRVASGAMEEVARSVDTVSRRLAKLAPTDTAALYRSCQDTVCGACPLQAVCWEQHGTEMRQGLEALTPLLKENGGIAPDQLQGYPAAHCRRRERLTDHINRGYGQLVAQEGAWRRLQELQQAVEGQFSGTGALLRGLATRLEDPSQVDIELSGRVLTVCEDHGLPVLEALCTRDGGNRLTVDILARDTGFPTEGRWLRQMEAVCGRTFGAPSTAVWGEQMRITLAEPPRYRVESGISQLRCGEEKLCGDTAQVEPLIGGVLTVLCDGMGSGGRAAVDSAMTAGIAARLWQAGFEPAAILQTVNAALMVKSREESLSTLDVAVIDIHSGRLDSYKAGAATTLLRSAGRVSRMERSSLPVGILPDVRFEHSHDTLSDGDVLLLLSDGALAGGVAAIEELLRDWPREGTMQGLTEAVTAAARTAEDGYRDDITAVALRLHRPAPDPT